VKGLTGPERAGAMGLERLEWRSREREKSLQLMEALAANLSKAS